MLIYKGKVLNEPGNVDFGSEDISGIGDGTVTGAIVALNSRLGLLWKNPNPSNSFASQNIQVDKSYKLYVIIFGSDAGSNYVGHTEMRNNTGDIGTLQDINASKNVIQVRSVVVTNDGFTFGDGYYSSIGESVNLDNNRNIPYAIYGIK